MSDTKVYTPQIRARLVTLVFETLKMRCVGRTLTWWRAPLPPSSKYGTCKTVMARFWPRLAGKSPENRFSCSLFGRTRTWWRARLRSRSRARLPPPEQVSKLGRFGAVDYSHDSLVLILFGRDRAPVQTPPGSVNRTRHLVEGSASLQISSSPATARASQPTFQVAAVF